MFVFGRQLRLGSQRIVEEFRDAPMQRRSAMHCKVMVVRFQQRVFATQGRSLLHGLEPGGVTPPFTSGGMPDATK
jgi:hypothetical protein